MTISLGRRFPDASSDLPEGLKTSRVDSWTEPRASIQSLPSYLVLLPMGFTEPSRSPGLLVSSYLTVSPLPSSRSDRWRRRSTFCCTFPTRSVTRSGGGRYPPSHPVESGLSSPGRSNLMCHEIGPEAIITPPRTTFLVHILGPWAQSSLEISDNPGDIADVRLSCRVQMTQEIDRIQTQSVRARRDKTT